MDQMNQFLSILAYIFILIGVPVVVKLISDFIRWKCSYLASKIQNEKMRHALLELSDVVSAAVAQTGQVYVDEVKKTGSFGIEAQAQALKKSKETALASLSSASKNFLEENHEDLEALLEAKVEEAVRAKKTEPSQTEVKQGETEATQSETEPAQSEQTL